MIITVADNGKIPRENDYQEGRDEGLMIKYKRT